MEQTDTKRVSFRRLLYCAIKEVDGSFFIFMFNDEMNNQFFCLEFIGIVTFLTFTVLDT